jgi:hypothetical protein
MEGNGSQEAE